MLKKIRYAIKHVPSGKFFYGDEGGYFLVDEEELFLTYGDKDNAEEAFSIFKSQGEMYFEDSVDSINSSEFILAEL